MSSVVKGPVKENIEEPKQGTVKLEDATREQLSSQSAKDLRDLIRKNKLKGVVRGFSSMKKPALVNNLLKHFRKMKGRKGEKRLAKKEDRDIKVAERQRRRREVLKPFGPVPTRGGPAGRGGRGARAGPLRARPLVEEFEIPRPGPTVEIIDDDLPGPRGGGDFTIQDSTPSRSFSAPSAGDLGSAGLSLLKRLVISGLTVEAGRRLIDMMGAEVTDGGGIRLGADEPDINDSLSLLPTRRRRAMDDLPPERFEPDILDPEDPFLPRSPVTRLPRGVSSGIATIATPPPSRANRRQLIRQLRLEDQNNRRLLEELQAEEPLRRAFEFEQPDIETDILAGIEAQQRLDEQIRRQLARDRASEKRALTRLANWEALPPSRKLQLIDINVMSVTPEERLRLEQAVNAETRGRGMEFAIKAMNEEMERNAREKAERDARDRAERAEWERERQAKLMADRRAKKAKARKRGKRGKKKK